MAEMSEKRIAAAERVAEDVWKTVLDRAGDMDDVEVVLSMLLTQLASRARGGPEPVLRRITRFVTETLEENRTEPRTH
jgi:hypothetical protein